VINAKVMRAARNNADWCDIVCRSHGCHSDLHDGIWINRSPGPRFYPNAQTLAERNPRQIELIKELVHAKLPAGWAVKDSFAALDLAPLGFTRLFEAQWIYMSSGTQPATVPAAPPALCWEIVRSASYLAEWESAWRDANSDANTARIFLPQLLQNKDVAVVAARHHGQIVAGAIGNLSAEVVGWSNFFAGSGQDMRACAEGSLVQLSRNFPDAPVVGYENGEMLELARSLGFESVGALRVWVFTDAR
jgi:hypothetical protein